MNKEKKLLTIVGTVQVLVMAGVGYFLRQRSKKDLKNEVDRQIHKSLVLNTKAELQVMLEHETEALEMMSNVEKEVFTELKKKLEADKANPSEIYYLRCLIEQEMLRKRSKDYSEMVKADTLKEVKALLKKK